MSRLARDMGLTFARENLLLGLGGEALALYSMELVGYPLLSDAEKWSVQGQLERLAHVVQADFSLWRVCGLEGEGRRVAVFLGVALGDAPAGGLTGALLGGADRLRARVAALLGRPASGVVSGARLAQLAEAEGHLFERLSSVVGVRRAQTRELEWLLGRAALRAVAEPAGDPRWAPDALVLEDPDGQAVYEPLGWDLWRLAAVVLSEDPDRPPSLRLEGEEHESWQAMLTVGALAEEPLFPGPAAELLRAPLDALAFPVDAVLHARWLGNREALGQVRKRVVDAEQTYRDQLESSHGPAWQADDDRTLAREYEQVLQSGSRPPMLYASLSLAVGAADPEELERRVERLRAAYGEVRLYRPRGLQEALWLDHLPRVDGGRVTDYVQHVSAQQFGAMVPTATTLIGDDEGQHLGHTLDGLRTPVLYDVTAPPREDRASAVLLLGTTGRGKTVTAERIGLRAMALHGSQVIDFDPKGDHYWSAVPDLAASIDVLELGGGQSTRAGALDPLVIAPPEVREDLALSYMLELLPDPPASWEHALARSVRDVVQTARPSARAVLQRLRGLDGSAGAEVADALEVIAEVGLGRLGFGEHRDSTAAASADLTTIRIPGLILPEQGIARQSYSRTERISVATLSLVAAKALQMVTADRTRHKVVIVDEAWFFLSSPQGLAFLNRMARYIRAFNGTLLLTQLVEDAPRLRDLVRTWLLFGHDSPDQLQVGLDLMGVEPAADLVARMQAARPGVCVMRDLRGRRAEIQVDAHDPALLAALDTSPPQPEPAEVIA